MGSLFGHFLTKFWTTFGSLWVSFGNLLGPLEVLLGSLWIQKHEKTNGFLSFLKMQLFGSLKLLMALLGSSCPLFGRSGPKMGPNKVPKNAHQRNQKLSKYFFFAFLDTLKISYLENLEVQFWDPKWTRVFAKKSKNIYKRNQDEPKRAIMSFKESNNCL